MDVALVNNLQVLAHFPPYGHVRLVPATTAWPTEPDEMPQQMSLETHSLAMDHRWSWLRPFLRYLSGDTDHAIVNYFLMMTRALQLLSNNKEVQDILPDAIAGLRRLQETTYQGNRFVKLAIITCRCGWEGHIAKEKNRVVIDC